MRKLQGDCEEVYINFFIYFYFIFIYIDHYYFTITAIHCKMYANVS